MMLFIYSDLRVVACSSARPPLCRDRGRSPWPSSWSSERLGPRTRMTDYRGSRYCWTSSCETLYSPSVAETHQHLYYYRRRMQMCLQDLTKISPSIRDSTPIIATICLSLDFASPLHLDGSVFAFILCFFTEFAFNVATPTARTPLPPRAPLCGKLHAEL